MHIYKYVSILMHASVYKCSAQRPVQTIECPQELAPTCMLIIQLRPTQLYYAEND